MNYDSAGLWFIGLAVALFSFMFGAIVGYRIKITREKYDDRTK